MTIQDSLLYRAGVVGPAALPIDVPNCGRANLAEWFAGWGFTRGAEIGTFAGEYAEMLCEVNPGLRLTCVDRWAPYAGYVDYTRVQTLDQAYSAASARLAPYGCELLRMDSLEAAAAVPDGSLDFVYIDANHLLVPFIQDLEAWVPKVRSGGIVAGHDYMHNKGSQVKPALAAYTSVHQIAPWFVLGRAKYRPGREVRDEWRSWLWVKA